MLFDTSNANFKLKATNVIGTVRPRHAGEGPVLMWWTAPAPGIEVP
jgi:hypothetical protein